MVDLNEQAGSDRGIEPEDEATLRARIADLEFKLHRNRREVRRLRQALAQAQAQVQAEAEVIPTRSTDDTAGELTVEVLKQLHAKIKAVA